MVRIISESSIAAGIRRIEAITGRAVEEMIDKTQDLVNSLRALFNNAPNLTAAIQKAINDNAELKKQVEEFKAQQIVELRKVLLEKARDINGTRVVSAVLPIDAQTAKDIVFQLRGSYTGRMLVVLGNNDAGKPGLTVSLSEELVAEGKHAGKMVKEAGRLIQGGGGGQAHFATAGGKDVAGLEEAVKQCLELAFE